MLSHSQLSSPNQFWNIDSLVLSGELDQFKGNHSVMLALGAPQPNTQLLSYLMMSTFDSLLLHAQTF